MRVVALVTQKGGSGKSTLAVSLSVVAQEAGEMVCVIDMDRQKSLSHWNERRESDEPLVVTADPRDLGRGLSELADEGFTLTVIDTAGMDQAQTGAAMRAADACLVPVQPSMLDMESCIVTARRLRQMKKPFRFVINGASPSAKDNSNEEARRALENLFTDENLVAQSEIPRRPDHVDAIGEGLGVSEHSPNGKAAREIRALWRELAALMQAQRVIDG